VSKSLTCVSGSLVPTCMGLSCMMPSSSESLGLGVYGDWGDSGVTSESSVWRESMEDDGSRSGQLVTNGNHTN